jgi:hypothetical protein
MNSKETKEWIHVYISLFCQMTLYMYFIELILFVCVAVSTGVHADALEIRLLLILAPFFGLLVVVLVWMTLLVKGFPIK